MKIYNMISYLVGGMGLFLLGMRLMTDGLKFAAGKALRNILASWTQTRLRGFASGVLITSLVQSSSAITLAVIGFVNAGLLSLSRAISITYGANVGTTMTAWLVSLVGFDFNIKLVALPLLGGGMLLRIIAGESRWGAFGEALAGFGLFFIGIDFLKLGFADLSDNFQWHGLNQSGWWGLLLFLGLGALLTVIFQSSSASLALILTAATGEVIPIPQAAAMVIGANIGTTSTAALAVIGATSNAKRVALAHIIFNVITGLVALAILPILIFLLQFLLTRNSPLIAQPATFLALFHTTFNLLGVLILWFFTPRLVRFLEKRFLKSPSDEAKPEFLDRTVLSTPHLAVHALIQELSRLRDFVFRMALRTINFQFANHSEIKKKRHLLYQLGQAIGDFCNQLQRSKLPPELDQLLPDTLRVSRYYLEATDVLVSMAKTDTKILPIENKDLETAILHFQSVVIQFLEKTNEKVLAYSPERISTELKGLEDQYQKIKSTILEYGAQGKIGPASMLLHLDLLSDMRRLVEQMEKGYRYLASIQERLEPKEPESKTESVAL